VGALIYDHIQYLICGLEPHLCIAQKLRLKAEGTYEGQQGLYSPYLNWDAAPCAPCVREIIVDETRAGEMHDHMVHRYVEEAFKNLHNLEVVDVSWLTT
jgi:hypothetical protein